MSQSGMLLQRTLRHDSSGQALTSQHERFGVGALRTNNKLLAIDWNICYNPNVMKLMHKHTNSDKT